MSLFVRMRSEDVLFLVLIMANSGSRDSLLVTRYLLNACPV